MAPDRPAARRRRLQACGSSFMPSLSATFLRKPLIDVQEVSHHALADRERFDLDSSNVSAMAM